MFECYFRTANGNLYQTWPRLPASWQRYMQREEDFTMAFWGRAALPWKMPSSRTESLVLIFHPEHFPTEYTVRLAQVLRFECARR